MARRRGFGEVRDGRIVEGGGDLDLVNQLAEASAENDSGVRLVRPGVANHGGSLFDLVVEVQHWMSDSDMDLPKRTQRALRRE